MINRGFGLLFEMGCGKTLTAIAIMGAAFKLNAIKKVLIVAPSSVVPVWPEELNEYACFEFICAALLKDKAKKLSELSSLEKCCKESDKLAIAVINYESTWRNAIFEALKKYDADMIICDESQRIKTPNIKQSNALHTLGDRARYKLILSGTPIQSKAMDVWSQYRFLDSTIFGTNYYAFRARYAVMGGFNGKQIVAYKNMSDLIRRCHSTALRVTKGEALDLPEQTFITRKVQLTPKARHLYDELKREGRASLEGQRHITTTTVLTKILRLQQLTGGFLATDESSAAELVCSSKLDALKDIIIDCCTEGDKKLVVFARFIPEIMAIVKLAKETLSKDKKVVAIHGGVKKTERGRIVDEFQKCADTMVFVGQIDTAGVGITLNAADTCVYYSKTYNYATYEQSLSRIHRIGQKNVCTYISLSVPGSVDEVIDYALLEKKDLAASIMDEWRNVL